MLWRIKKEKGNTPQCSYHCKSPQKVHPATRIISNTGQEWRQQGYQDVHGRYGKGIERGIRHRNARNPDTVICHTGKVNRKNGGGDHEVVRRIGPIKICPAIDDSFVVELHQVKVSNYDQACPGCKGGTSVTSGRRLCKGFYYLPPDENSDTESQPYFVFHA